MTDSMGQPENSRPQLHLWKLMAIVIPVLTVLLMLLIVLLDDGAEIPTTFQYRLY